MTRRKFSREFKIEAVKLVTDRGVSVAQACRDLELAESVLRRWMREAALAPATAFPGNGQQRAELAEIAALKKEVAKLKAERDILNDAKSSTYKLGLLRALARAADGAQGIARITEDDRVILPLGLVALNWLRLYKPLLEAGLPQSPKNVGTDGLGFVGEAWDGIREIAAHELRVGSVFAMPRAAALHGALRDAAITIARMPATFMTYPGSSEPIFPTRRGRLSPGASAVRLNAAYLWSFGEITVPLHLWRALVRFDAWIEPALVAEWVRVMEGYAEGQGRRLDPGVVARSRSPSPARIRSLMRATISRYVAPFST